MPSSDSTTPSKVQHHSTHLPNGPPNLLDPDVIPSWLEPWITRNSAASPRFHPSRMSFPALHVVNAFKAFKLSGFSRGCWALLSCTQYRLGETSVEPRLGLVQLVFEHIHTHDPFLSLWLWDVSSSQYDLRFAPDDACAATC